MTQPDHKNPPGAHNPTHPGSFLEWQRLTEASIYDKSKAPIVGPTGSATRAQQDIAATDGNVLPSGSALWQAFTRNADATFPRIMLRRHASGVSASGSSSSAGSHSHSVNGSSTSSAGSHSHSVSVSASLSFAVPDYQPAGHGANYGELGFIECSKDRTYTRATFITGDSWTLLGIGAMYVELYLMSPSTGDLTLVSQTGDIKSLVSDTNTEYTVNLNSAVAAAKGEIFAVGTRQITSAAQTCNSLCQLTFWPLSAPSGFKPVALYAYTPGSPAPLASAAYSSLTFDNGFVPYYALS
ncbi:hypothetical protein [Nocardia brasiliensis]|uniref:hypothetical protein n=1 Tax=Nocardia brasiliensis TaxID=37326 RepID=UPI002457F0D3|nr:hypothetical protein [Nocardia brasiliensis]